jgi:hypothetical protein
MVAAILWMAVAGYTNYVDCGWYKVEEHYSRLGQRVCYADLIPFGFDARLLCLLLPPALMLLSGIAVLWCVQGFRQKS